MKSVKGTQTEKNLLTSFAGESQASNRYDFFAKVAKKEGYVQIANIFTETAENERVHAKQMFKWLEGGMVEIKAAYPTGPISDTLQNLKEAAAGEHEEWYVDYPKFAEVAEQEGFPEIAKMYRAICVAERAHEDRYLKLLANVETEHVFEKDEEAVWMCIKCGYIHTGKEAPLVCPACGHPQSYYELQPKNY